MQFGENLFRYRKLRGVTQEKLAEIMQVSRQSVSKWENGETVPELSKVIKVANVLGVSLDELCGRSEGEKDLTESLPSYEEEAVIIEEIPICQEKKSQKWSMSKILRMIVIVFISILCGFAIGCVYNSDIQSFLQMNNVEIASVDFDVEGNILTCVVVPEVYSEDFSYSVLVTENVSDGISRKRIENVMFENGVGKVDVLVDSSYFYNLVLQVSDGEYVRNLNMVKRLYVNTDTGQVFIHEK